jgi:hypothetical protein
VRRRKPHQYRWREAIFLAELQKGLDVGYTRWDEGQVCDVVMKGREVFES